METVALDNIVLGGRIGGSSETTYSSTCLAFSSFDLLHPQVLMWEAGFDQVPPEPAPPRLNMEGDAMKRTKHPDRHSLIRWVLKARDIPERIIVTANRVEGPITMAALDRPLTKGVKPLTKELVRLVLFVSFVLGIYKNLGIRNRTKLIKRILKSQWIDVYISWRALTSAHDAIGWRQIRVERSVN